MSVVFNVLYDLLEGGISPILKDFLKHDEYML